MLTSVVLFGALLGDSAMKSELTCCCYALGCALEGNEFISRGKGSFLLGNLLSLMASTTGPYWIIAINYESGRSDWDVTDVIRT